jgi:hypothetical protein
MADRSYIAGGVSGHPGGCHSANRHRQVPGWEPPMDVTMFWGRNANERDGYRAPPVIGWSTRIRRTPGHLTVPVRRVCCRLEELVWYDEGSGQGTQCNRGSASTGAGRACDSWGSQARAWEPEFLTALPRHTRDGSIGAIRPKSPTRSRHLTFCCGGGPPPIGRLRGISSVGL